MKKVFCMLVGSLLVVSMIAVYPGALMAGEHGGSAVKEHGGKTQEHSGSSVASDRDVLLEAASALSASHPALAAKIRKIAHKQ